MSAWNWGDSQKSFTRSWIVAAVALTLLLIFAGALLSISLAKGGVRDPASPLRAPSSYINTDGGSLIQTGQR